VRLGHDILGHEPILGRLGGALVADRLHHAYLFEGAAGVGRRLVALRLAQAANCEAASEQRPCGSCRTCKSIAAGTHPDVLFVEPDPARATPIITVDQIRAIVRASSYHRYAARRRFVVIDPAEAMPPPAANALLKTLEEPPDGTGFILITAQPAALLPTILSRCQRVRFGAVAVDRIVAWLEAQGLSHAQVRARAALGCPGVALALTDEALEARAALRDTVLRAAGSGDLGAIFETSKAMCEGQRAQWRPRVEQLFEILEDLLRDATILAAGASVPLLGDARLAERAALRLWPGGIARMSTAITEARAALALNAAGRTVVDALLTRLATELGKL